MRIATWNVNGIRARQGDVQAWLEADHPDIVCLQELKALPEQIPASLHNMEDYWNYWHGGPKGYSGVSLHVRKELAPERPVFSHPAFDLENRIVAVQLGDIHIVSVYVPNGGKSYPVKLQFIESLAGYARALRAVDAGLVICGDINIARTGRDVHPSERKAVIGQLPEERLLFEKMIDAGLVDLGREMAPDDDRLFTWWAPWRNMRARNVGWRLDYVLASDHLARKVTSCTVQRETGTSDHAPVVAAFG